MSTSTITSRKSCGTAESAATTSSCESRSTTRSCVADRLARRLLELVVEVVVAFLERLHLGRALLAPAAVDVEVREDPEEPRAQVRPRRVRAPAAERPRIRLLHQVLGLLAAADETPRHPVDLIRELERFLLEPHAVACLRRQAPGLRWGSSRSPATLAALFRRAATTLGQPIPADQASREEWDARAMRIVTAEDETIGHVVAQRGRQPDPGARALPTPGTRSRSSSSTSTTTRRPCARPCPRS